MALITVYFYDSRPHLLAIDFKWNELDWRKMFTFAPIHAPFIRRSMVEYEDNDETAVLEFRELGKYDSYPGQFGVKFRLIKMRFEGYRRFRRFVIRIDDLQQLFGPGYNMSKIYSWELSDYGMYRRAQ